MVDLSGELPTALREATRRVRLGPSRIPALIVHPDWESGHPAPLVLWMHGRTVSKELDPGRYLRWMRSGLATCAVDLPGHGERFDAVLQDPSRTLAVVEQMTKEIDEIIEALEVYDEFDRRRLAIGGMSAGGMAAMRRLCSPHPFVCASVEATSGSWRHQKDRAMFRGMTEAQIRAFDPVENLDAWREIPFQALHARHDEWVDVAGQQAFIDALKQRYDDPSIVEFHIFDRTGAPNEHAGFGRMSHEAKSLQTSFFMRWLQSE